MHCEPNFFELSTITSGFSTAAVLIDTLSAPQLSNLLISSTLLTPPPTVKGTKHFLDVFYHLLMYLEANEIKIEEVMQELEKRKK